MPRWPTRELVGGQGVQSDLESEGFEEKYRAVIKWGKPRMNRSAKDGGKVEPAVWGRRRSHSPIAPRCLLTARYGRFIRDPRRSVRVLVCVKDWVSAPISASEAGNNARAEVGERNST